MRKYAFLALMALAAPSFASADRSATLRRDTVPVDRLYPEIEVSEDGWRALLPVILLDTDVAEAPAPVTTPKDIEPR